MAGIVGAKINNTVILPDKVTASAIIN